MKLIKFSTLLLLTIFIIYFFNNRIVIYNVPVPPLGKLLDPNHGFWQNAQSDSLEYSKQIDLEHLSDKVMVEYDSNAVPHIYASNNRDLYSVQGYVIAQHRLWQMEFQTHAAAGRVSEIIGENGLEFDRKQRRKGMVYGAEKTYASMLANPKVKVAIEAYADGVNQYISSLNYKDLPLEYKLLGYEPEKWTPFKSALILEFMVDNLTGRDEDFEDSNFIKLFGLTTYNLLFPESPEGVEPVITTNPDSLWNFTTLPLDTPQIDLPTDLVNNILPKPDADNGSNNWVISGSKSYSGRPILCNDTHLGLNLPSLWIMAQLQSPDVNVYGFTFTGAAGITIGFNESVAWGFTNAPRDNRDWYNIKFKDDSQKEYKYNNQWKKSKIRLETIKIRGDKDFIDTVYYTLHGPVVYDKNFGNNKNQSYALTWIGHKASKVQKALLDLNRAKSYGDYAKAITNWDAPPQNIAFASTSGDIALKVQGQYTAKWTGQGKFIMDGNNPTHIWQKDIPKNENPYELNPKGGFVSSANQHSVDSLYPYWVYNANNEYYRNRIIHRLLEDNDKLNIEDLKNIQLNSYSILAEEVLPILLDSINIEELDATEQKAITLLQKWDYNYRANDYAPTYFEAWWSNLKTLLWDEILTSGSQLRPPGDYNSYLFIKNLSNHEWVDIQSSKEKESLTAVINKAFKISQQEILDWQKDNGVENKWGNYKGTFVKHLADLNKSLAGFSRYNIQVDGVAEAINSTKKNHGPSQRFIVEMSSPPKAWVVYPGGQSGNPGSPLYDNMIDLWKDGEYLPVTFTVNSLNPNMIYSQTFYPANK